MRNTLRASILVLALCCPALAGDIPCPIVEPPPPQPTSDIHEATPDVEIQIPRMPEDSARDGAAAVTFFEVVLNLLALL